MNAGRAAVAASHPRISRLVPIWLIEPKNNFMVAFQGFSLRPKKGSSEQAVYRTRQWRHKASERDPQSPHSFEPHRCVEVGEQHLDPLALIAGCCELFCFGELTCLVSRVLIDTARNLARHAGIPSDPRPSIRGHGRIIRPYHQPKWTRLTCRRRSSVSASSPSHVRRSARALSLRQRRAQADATSAR